MPASKNSNYRSWTLKFEEYWINNDVDHHAVLLSFCKDASIIDQSVESLLDHDILQNICNDPLISQPFDFDGVSKQQSKKFHHLRQCVLAELLLVMGVDKDRIHYVPAIEYGKKNCALCLL